MSANYDDLVTGFSSEDDAWTIVVSACYTIKAVGTVPRRMLEQEICLQAGISRQTFDAMIDSLIKCRIVYQHGQDLVWLGDVRH